MKSYRKQLVSLGVFALLVFGLLSNVARAAFSTIDNDAWKTTTGGQTIYAQQGYILKVGSTYYWYGQKYQSMVNYRTGSSNAEAWLGTQVYTSTNLTTWSNATVAVAAQGVLTSSSDNRRVMGVVRNSAGTYVMWMKSWNANDGNILVCLTSSSPSGPFTISRIQTAISGLYNNPYPGDGSLFTDPVGGGVYLICADSHGRQRAYICPLSSDRRTINGATQIATWPQGQEAGNMFYNTSKQRYHYITSETNGYSYSFAYEVRSSSLFGTYSNDFILPGTQPTNTYWSQVTYCVPVVGTSGTVYMMMGDRWANRSSNYANAGHGTGFNVWCPITFPSGSNTTPTFQARATWQIDAAAGTWQ
jgi:hypothetical protein